MFSHFCVTISLERKKSKKDAEQKNIENWFSLIILFSIQNLCHFDAYAVILGVRE